MFRTIIVICSENQTKRTDNTSTRNTEFLDRKPDAVFDEKRKLKG
jgi:hypothetical protein